MTRSDHDEQIAAMFDGIAHHYDLLNRALSFGQDGSWRRRAIAAAGTRAGPALDVGAGTGDLAFGLARAGSRPVVAIDLARGMLAQARHRDAGGALGLVAGSAERLPFADRTFDTVVAGFAVRNFGNLARGLREMRRVLRPGGRVVIVELSLPANALLRRLHLVYMHRLGPLVAALLGSTPEAYRYLPASIERFPDPERVAGLLREAGFDRVRYERLTFGVATIHVADA